MSFNSLLRYKKNFLDQLTTENLKNLIGTESIFGEKNLELTSILSTPFSELLTLYTYNKYYYSYNAFQENFSTNQIVTYSLLTIYNNILNSLYKEYNTFEAYKTAKINSILFLKNKVAQKISSLEISAGNSFTYTIKEDFLNSDFINEKSTLETKKTFLTLPTQSEKKININDIVILSGSKGSFGSSDSEYPNTNTIFDLISGKQIQWEQIYNESCIFSFELLYKEDIVNYIDISVASIDEVSECTLVRLAANTTQGFKSLINNNIKLSIGTNRIYFYPNRSSSIEITLQQSNGYPLQLKDKNSIIRKVISLDSISIGKIQFASSGILYSNPQDILQKVYSCSPKLNILPTNSNLFNYSGKLSLDNKKSYFDFNTIGSSLDINSLYYEFELNRNDSAFEQNSSINEEEQIYDFYTQTQFLSPFKSPGTIVLDKNSINKKFIIYRPNILKYGELKDSIQIGTGIGSKYSVKLLSEAPYELIDKALLTVDEEEWTYTESLTTASASDKVWTINKENYQDILFGDDTNGFAPLSGSIIKFCLPLEKLSFSFIEGGFRAKVNNLFDPDKDQIRLISVSESTTAGKQILKRNTKVHKLPYQNLVEGSVKIVEKTVTGEFYSPTVFVSEETFINGKDELVSGGDYSINYKTGYIYTYTMLQLDNVATCSFSFYPTKTLTNDSYSIVYNNVPEGIFVPSDRLPVSTVVDTVTSVSTPLEELTPLGVIALAQRAPKVNDHSFPLKRKGIIKGTLDASNLFATTTIATEELLYIDGYSEFLGLIKVDKENISSYSGAGVYNFTIFAGSNFYSPLGITFSDSTYFTTERTSLAAVTSAGHYYISPTTGIVSVYVASSLPSGIYASYYYRNNSFVSTNKYSIDYDKGILYSLTQFKTDGYIEYKVANIFISYSLIQEFDNFEFDENVNILSIKTDKILSKNDIVKISYPILNKKVNIAELKDYYSPLIDSIEFGFR